LIAAMPTLASTRTVVGGMSKKRSENKKLHQRRRKARPQSGPAAARAAGKESVPASAAAERVRPDVGVHR
jgi:hypothetical protein